MGWYYPPDATTQAALRELLNAQRQGVTLIAQKATYYGRHLWSVYQTKASPTNPIPHRFINLDLLDYGPAHQSWGYKETDESMGPCHYECPLELLDLAGPDDQADGTYARAWRAKVRAYHAKTKQRWLPGSHVTIDGHKHFIVKRQQRRRVFMELVPDGGYFTARASVLSEYTPPPEATEEDKPGA